MKGLIVVADDFGADRARNMGIIQAMEAGCVTAVSLLANAPGTEDALCYLQDFKVASVGLHLNLSEGKPLSGGLTRLVGPNYHFLGKKRAWNLLSSNTSEALTDEISLEVETQLDRVVAAGVKVQFINGHQHVHLLPPVLGRIIEACKKHNIPWTRLPWEPAPASNISEDPEARVEALMFSHWAEKAKDMILGARVRCPDHFLGLYWKGRLNWSLFKEVVRPLPGDLIELMVHPGKTPRVGEEIFSPFSNEEREKELVSLLDPCFKETLLEGGIDLVRYPEVR